MRYKATSPLDSTNGTYRAVFIKVLFFPQSSALTYAVPLESQTGDLHDRRYKLRCLSEEGGAGA